MPYETYIMIVYQLKIGTNSKRTRCEASTLNTGKASPQNNELTVVLPQAPKTTKSSPSGSAAMAMSPKYNRTRAATIGVSSPSVRPQASTVDMSASPVLRSRSRSRFVCTDEHAIVDYLLVGSVCENPAPHQCLKQNQAFACQAVARWWRSYQPRAVREEMNCQHLMVCSVLSYASCGGDV